MQTHPPQKGFYYHYKHDPALGFNNYTYEVLGTVLDTESEKVLVMYRPLYHSKFIGDNDCFVRPLDMFLENVTVDGVSVP